jgi:preprotein translocase subunit SecB
MVPGQCHNLVASPNILFPYAFEEADNLVPQPDAVQ